MKEGDENVHMLTTGEQLVASYAVGNRLVEHSLFLFDSGRHSELLAPPVSSDCKKNELMASTSKY